MGILAGKNWKSAKTSEPRLLSKRVTVRRNTLRSSASGDWSYAWYSTRNARGSKARAEKKCVTKPRQDGGQLFRVFLGELCFDQFKVAFCILVRLLGCRTGKGEKLRRDFQYKEILLWTKNCHCSRNVYNLSFTHLSYNLVILSKRRECLKHSMIQINRGYYLLLCVDKTA